MTETQAVLVFWMGIPSLFFLLSTARLMLLHWQDLNNPDTPIDQNLITPQKGNPK